MIEQSKFGVNFRQAKAPPMTRLLSAPKAQTGRIRLRTLILIRWIAVGGQITTILFVYAVMGYDLPLAPVLAVVGVSALLNIVLDIRYPSSKRLSDKEAALYLAYDTLQLAVLLYFTGGLHNPFSFLMLGAALISAPVLSVRMTFMLGALIVTCVTGLGIFHLPLPWTGGVHSLSHIYVFGIWTSITLAMVFFSINVLRVAEEGRRMSDALTETQMALAREQRLSAVGGLAAATAHELGTPLGTIALVAKELARDLPEEGAHAEDLKLLISQSERCRDILAKLTLSPEDGYGPSISHVPLVTLVELAVNPHRREGIDIVIDHASVLTGKDRQGVDEDESRAIPQPVVPHRLEIIYGLENLIENAVDFARERVSVKVGWSESEVVIEIVDDGPGFARNILGALGEPYVSTRRESGGMGLGAFIAKTLLERTGAEIEFGNRKVGGARIVVTWPRALLEEDSPTTDEGLNATVAGNARQ